MGEAVEFKTFDYDTHLGSVLALWEMSWPGVRISRSDSPERIRHKLERDPDLFLVAEQGGEVIGAVMGGYDGRRGMVYHLAVRSDARNRGVGKKLLEELESRLRAKGCVKYYLLVTRDNSQTIAFYENLGVQIMDLYVMGKDLE